MAVTIPIISEFDGKGVSRAVAEFKQLETRGEKAQFAIKKAALPAAAALAGLAAAAGPAISAASDLQENLSKVNVIFGEGAKEIEAFSKTAATALGQSQNAVLQAAGTFGTFGKAAGLGGVELAKFSNDFTGLASDLASFNNTTPEDAIQAIGAALRGEAEPLRRYGVLLNDASLKAAALSLGIYDGSGALTDQQKILAAQKIIFEQTSDAQGDFARTSEGLANSGRILTAQLKDIQTELGQALLPILEKVLPLLKTFATWAKENPGPLKVIAAAIGGVALAILAVNAAMALNPFGLIAIGIAAVITGVTIAYTKFETFRKIVETVLNGLIAGFEVFANSWIGAINLIIRGLNVINPFGDIPLIPTISLGRLGGKGATTPGINDIRTADRIAREAGEKLPSIPDLAAAGAIGGGGGGGGGAAAAAGIAAAAAAISTPDLAALGNTESARLADLALLNAQPATNITINSTIADDRLGDVIVNALRQYNRTSGPIDVLVV